MIITAGKFKGQKVVAPDEKITRPTLSKVRMSVFNTLQSMIEFDGASFLDMYAGSGIMGLEALSRGFERVVAIEKNPKSAKIVRENYAKIEDRRAGGQEGKQVNISDNSKILKEIQTDNDYSSRYLYLSDTGLSSCSPAFLSSILTGDSLKIVPKLTEKFDVVYIDPPYFSGVYENSLEVVKNVSDIVVLEHVTNVDFSGYEVLKQKKYGDKFITFLRYDNSI